MRFPADHPAAVGAEQGGGDVPSCQGTVGILSGGLWRKRKLVRQLLDMEPVRVRPWRRSGYDAIAGWGHKPTADGARKLAARRALPYIAIEDGFLRSVEPGERGPALGWIVDRSGIYYDSGQPSDFEAAVNRRAAAGPGPDDRRIRSALARIRQLRLSKYNHAPSGRLELPTGKAAVFVIDQTFGDASVSGAGADAARFRDMLDAAIAENSGRTIVVKAHPESVAGTKRGYLLDHARERGVKVIAENVNPWTLIENAERFYVVSSQMGFEAALAGVPVTTFASGFFAGWGLTDDRFAQPRRRLKARREDLAAAAYLDYCLWRDPFSGSAIDFEAAIDLLAAWRDDFNRNR